jgi:hypothetical protein
MSQPDGLAALQGRRQAAAARRGRALPPPRHPRREPPAPEPTGEAQGAALAPVEPGVASAELASLPASRAPARSATPQRGRGRGGAGLRLGQFYLDPASDQWIRAVRLAAMQAGEDITGSAVVRWAIARAAGEVTPEQVIHELLAAPLHRTGPGRPRR